MCGVAGHLGGPAVAGAFGLKGLQQRLSGFRVSNPVFLKPVLHAGVPPMPEQTSDGADASKGFDEVFVGHALGVR